MNDQYRKNPRKLHIGWEGFFVLWPSRWPLTIRSGGVWTRYAHLTLTPKHTFISRAEAFSISLVWLVLKHWFKSCFQSGDSHWAIRLWEKTSERVQRFLSSSFPLSAPNSRPPLCSDSHSRCRSMSEHLLGRLDHSLLRTGCGPNTVSREHMVDRTGGDSDDDLLDVNQDAYAIALTLAHQMQPQQVVQGPIVMREEPLEWYVNPTSKTWCCWSRASLLE